MNAPFDGQTRLLRLLQDAGMPMDAASLQAFMEGVAAAPEGFDGPVWLELIVPGPDAELRRELLAYRKFLAARPDGLGESKPSPRRLEAVRAELRRRGLAGFIVPRADEHQGEYVPKRAQRLAWLTGFTGSAGSAIVLLDKAVIFVDGRYTLQVRQEVDEAQFQSLPMGEITPDKWISENLPPGARLGFDPWLHSLAESERLAAACKRAGGELLAVAGNPIDVVWPDQPPAPIARVAPHDLAHAGMPSETKRQVIAAQLRARKLDAFVIGLPDSIAWLLNLRGGDVPRAPLPLSFAMIHADETVELFIDRRKVSAAARDSLGNRIALKPPEDLGPSLDALGKSGKRVGLDAATAPRWIADRLAAAGAVIERELDPTLLPKACKNPVEIEGTRKAHRRDGAAVSKYLAWLAREADSGGLDELTAADRLEQFRRESDLCRDLSFDTISGAGANGAVVHYRASERTNRKLRRGELYLVDSGAQYPDGTTDITRTIAIGEPSAEMRDRFTRVLKGHIALATARFPQGTTGSQLDALARLPLWQAGLDYDHGTGHGVGSFLSVHEGPQRISKLPNTVALAPGMIVSDEPGYYKAGEYGIRIENLVLVRESDLRAENGKTMLEFETLTLAPIDRHLIDATLLSRAEIDWLNDYHARVREAIEPLVDAHTAQWLEDATAPVG